MKRIDFHIHTIATISDKYFEFSLDTLKKYVDDYKLDAIAITNHDTFDLEQYHLITENLNTKVFPGIEINLEMGHILLITRESDAESFNIKAKKVREKIKSNTDSISYEELIDIFGNLSNYLIIPHYEKKPAIQGETLEKLTPYIEAGEVNSAKKFIRNIKDNSKLTPVLFTDTRISKNIGHIPPRHTFLDCGEISLDSIKTCLKDKTKVTLSAHDGNELWEIFENGQKISTGLNILIGTRSSGKTYTLEKIYNTIPRTKYIKQFSLVQSKDDDENFKTEIENQKSLVIDEYLSTLKHLIEDISKISLVKNEKNVENYVATLIKSALDHKNQDEFSKCKLFEETPYPVSKKTNIANLIESIKTLIENTEYNHIIQKHISVNQLKSLILELISLSSKEKINSKKQSFINEIINETKQLLNLHTSATPINDVDLYQILIEDRKVKKFNNIIRNLKSKSVIHKENIQGFNIVISKEEFRNASEIGQTIRKKNFAEAFQNYKNPYEYLNSLKQIESVASSDYFKLFAKINYEILNKDGYPVSGGERSEFRLLQEIKDANNHDILLIDEPESSFDNIFLNSNVNKLIKSISQTMPVIVVTHNSTIGASIGANYILHTSKEKTTDGIVYKIYSGHFGDKYLYSTDGTSIKSHCAILNTLEAGPEAYNSRNSDYATLEN